MNKWPVEFDAIEVAQAEGLSYEQFKAQFLGEFRVEIETIDVGDTVFHYPTGEEWMVAYADYKTNKLSWCGYPTDGEADIQDCVLVEKATPKAMHKLLVELANSRLDKAKRLSIERLNTLDKPNNYS